MGPVWANFHTGFMLGLIAVLLTLIGDWCEQHFHANSPMPDRPRPLAPMQLSLLIGAALLGSTLTPYGLKLHIYVVSLANATELSAPMDVQQEKWEDDDPYRPSATLKPNRGVAMKS